jgi:hypothetical protein
MAAHYVCDDCLRQKGKDEVSTLQPFFGLPNGPTVQGLFLRYLPLTMALKSMYSAASGCLKRDEKQIMKEKIFVAIDNPL